MKEWFISAYAVHVGTSRSTWAGWIRTNKGCGSSVEMMGSEKEFSLWVKIKNRESKVSEVSVAFLQIWQFLSWFSTEIHPGEFLLTKTFLRYFTTNKSLAGRLEFLERLCWSGDKSVLHLPGWGTGWSVFTGCTRCYQYRELCSWWLMESHLLSICTGNCSSAVGSAAELRLLQTLRYLICKHLIKHSLQ